MDPHNFVTDPDVGGGGYFNFYAANISSDISIEQNYKYHLQFLHLFESIGICFYLRRKGGIKQAHSINFIVENPGL